jgi:ketosteroid isomerase-like protein
MDRASVERVIREGYAARLNGDLDATCRHFAEDSHFALAGSPDASPVASSARGHEAIRGALAGLMEAVDFVRHDITEFVIDGDRAAVHSRVRVRAKATGEEADTEMVDLVTVRDGKIASFVQFCDTALAAKLLGGGAAPT